MASYEAKEYWQGNVHVKMRRSPDSIRSGLPWVVCLKKDGGGYGKRKSIGIRVMATQSGNGLRAARGEPKSEWQEACVYGAPRHEGCLRLHYAKIWLARRNLLCRWIFFLAP
jgi:hypothetical protein